MPPFNAPSWKSLVTLAASDAGFAAPAAETEIAAVERTLGLRLPPGLREFLQESDGVTADYGSGVVWPVADIQRRNQEFRGATSLRELYMPFDHLLFFGDDGGGNQFAFAIQADGHIHKSDVYQWEHETDARSWFAGNLESFLARRLKQSDVT